jgi:hypothetical protein
MLCLLEEATWKPGTGCRLTKGRFGATKSQEYQTANWKWVVGRVAKWKGSSKPDLFIKVTVWDEEEKPANPKLGKNFSSNQLNKAKQYAKDLVDSGKAVMVDITGMATFPYEGDKVIEDFGSYEVPD